jgi:hypothetical protein
MINITYLNEVHHASHVFTIKEVMEALAAIDASINDIITLIVAPYPPDSKC